MLAQAVKAELPIIAVTTRDPIHAREVIATLTGRKVFDWEKGKNVPMAKRLYYSHDQVAVTPELYASLLKADNSTLILINQVSSPLAFRAGEIPVPRKSVIAKMNEIVGDDKLAQDLAISLGGCTLKEATEYAALTMTRDHGLTPQGIMRTRRSFFQTQEGMSIVDTTQDFYEPPEDLNAYIKKEHDFFLYATDWRLVPRGLLLTGPTGTGKTAGAKWLAEQWGLPLLRIDVGGTKGKYHGESEHNMLANLQRVEAEAPCVVLFDEIEKIFKKTMSSDNVSSSMMSQLLWWLAERRSRTFVMMTTNDETVIPPELFRDGRIDRTMRFDGLDPDDAYNFVVSILNTFGEVLPDSVGEDTVQQIIADVTPKVTKGDKLPLLRQAELTHRTYAVLKDLIIAESHDK